jgi:hypothetical protein
MINSMIDLQSMTVRDLIAALAEAEDATRRVRRSRTGRHHPDDPELATLVAHEDLLVGELRRRAGSHHPHRV